MGLDLCQVPDGCRLVLLPLLAAKIFVRCPRLQRKGGWYLRVDSLRRGRAWLSAGRRVLELFGSASGVVGSARKIALGLSAAVMPTVILVTHVPVSWALAIFSLAYFGQQSWSTLIMVLPADLFPRRIVGSIAGLVGFGGAIGGIAFGQLAGYLLDHGFGYGLVFTLAGTFHVAAFLLILATIPTVRPLSLQRKMSYSGAW